MKRYLPATMFVGILFAIPAYAGAASDIMCTQQYQPVCGGKQVQCIKSPCYPVYHTYSNSCMMQAEGGYFIHEGECTASETGFIPPARDTYTPPKGCVSWFDGCNTCSLQSNGQAACTLMACEDKPAPGRCIRYESDKPAVQPSKPSDHTSTSSPIQGSTTEAGAVSTTTEPARDPGFVFRIWNFILSLLPWH